MTHNGQSQPHRIGTLGDRLANRIVRHFPGPRVRIAPARPIVSFTFDDVPESAWRNGAALLEDAGVRGTFYIAGGLVGGSEYGRPTISREGCLDLARRGHELASHGFVHHKLGSFSRDGLKADLDRNALFLEECDNTAGRRNFAVPYTMSWPPALPELRRRFQTSRGGQPGINRDLVDPHNLLAVELRDGGLDSASARQWIDDVVAQPGWLIFFTHDILPEDSEFGCTTERFSALVEMAITSGCEVLTIRAAAEKLGLHQAA